MKHVYFTATIPAGSFLIVAYSGTYSGLSYLDFCDRTILYRYFEPAACRVERVPAREARRLEKRLPRARFRDLQEFGSWR